MGMQHDFELKSLFERVPCYDSKGQDCLKMKGLMSYEVCHFYSIAFLETGLGLLRPIRFTYNSL